MGIKFFTIWLFLLSVGTHYHLAQSLIISISKSKSKQLSRSFVAPLLLYKDGIDYSFLSESRQKSKKEDLLTKDQFDYVTTLVDSRSHARDHGEYELADSIRNDLDSLSGTDGLPVGYKVEIRDIPRKEGGGSKWNLQLNEEEPIDWVDEKNGDDDNESVLRIAHAALGLASLSSENNMPLDCNELQGLVRKAKDRLRETGLQELRGRKAADAAFWFAMAGVCDDEIKDEKNYFSLFDALTFICIEELKRFGKRSSCRATDIMHMVERIAASGIQGPLAKALQEVASDCLLTKDLNATILVENGTIYALQKGKFDLHSDRSLIWIWRFSTRQRKQQAFLKSAAKHWASKIHSKGGISTSADLSNLNEKKEYLDWDTIYDDLSLPLIIDIGCGMGISTLGLSSSSSNEVNSCQNDVLHNIEWSRCNYLGVDLSQLAINYALSISHRWGLKGRVHFVTGAAEYILEKVVETYPSEVKLIMIQFPTPFTLQLDHSNDEHCEEKKSVVNRGNSQLPSSAYSGFMVTKRLLDLARLTFNGGSGKLLLQSNCEDVAVLMKNLAIRESGFQTIDVQHSVKMINEEKARLTERTKKWIEMGGERAEGVCWSSKSLLPSKGSTETETACHLNRTPVHRCILK